MKKRLMPVILFITVASILLMGCSSIKDEEKSNPDTAVKVEYNIQEKEQDEEKEKVEEIDKKEKDFTFENMSVSMFAQRVVNVRSGPNTDFDKVGSLSINQEVKVTGRCNETSWYRINYNGVEAYVSNNYLSDKKVEVRNNDKVTTKEEAKVPESNNLKLTDTGNSKLNSLCDNVLKSIVNNNMSDREKAYAVYSWVEKNIRYSGVSDMSNWKTGGVTALSTKKGNCYAYYSASRALLTRLGFETIEISEEDKSHYWNLVKVNGSWYHFDTTSGWGTQRFLWTDSQMSSYEYYNKNLGRNISYDWDKTAYPATP